MSTRSIRGVIAAAAALLIAVTAAGCTPTVTESEGHTASGTGLTRGVTAAGFDDVYMQSLDWHECAALDPKVQEKFDAAGRVADARECTTVSAPLDWNDPANTERIELAVTRYPATGPTKLGSLLVNPGGPGGDGQSLASRLAAEPRADELLAAYDVVGMDPRGIGESSPPDCTADDGDTPDSVLFAECLRDNPITHHMGTSSVAKDMDAIRFILGDPQLNYLGYSYGTALGATYASLFPEHVGRMVLDSAIDATWAGSINHFDQTEAIARASGELGASCAVTNTTAFPCAWADLDGLEALEEQLAETPWVASDGTEIGDQYLKGYVTMTNYKVNEERAHRLELIAGAAAGDQPSIDALAADSASASVGQAGSIVSCFSEPVHQDLIAFYEHVLAATDADTAASWVADLGTRCSLLAEQGTDFTETFDATGSHPILVVGVTGDHATPYEKAVSLVDQLKTARLVTLEANQHGSAYLKQNAACIDAIVTAYFLDGTMPAEGTVCQLDGVG